MATSARVCCRAGRMNERGSRSKVADSRRITGFIVFVRGARRSEHAHIVSKWRPTMNLTTECSENVCSEYESLDKTMVTQTSAL